MLEHHLRGDVINDLAVVHAGDHGRGGVDVAHHAHNAVLQLSESLAFADARAVRGVDSHRANDDEVDLGLDPCSRLADPS